MLEKLESIQIRFDDIAAQMTDPGIMTDQKRYRQLSKDYSALEKIVKVYKKYKNILSNLEDSRQILKEEEDQELKDMAKMEIGDLESKKTQMEEDINMMLIPKDEEDDKNAILEIRAGTGGDEAGIFVGDLFKMYSKYIDNRGWKMEIITLNESSSGGFKEVGVEVKGDNVYADLKYESGVHRVQRVPKTESQGRVHTSAASVAVLPEAEELDVDINPADLRWDTYRASGAGGQHVNKTESAVRVTHNPTGVVAESQESRNQLRNREIALTMLRTKIYEMELKKKNDAIAAERRTLVSTGDRSAKIRTYNWPQGRVTDHRINLTLYHLDSIIGGDIQGIIDALKVAENTEKLKSGETI